MAKWVGLPFTAIKRSSPNQPPMRGHRGDAVGDFYRGWGGGAGIGGQGFLVHVPLWIYFSTILACLALNESRQASQFFPPYMACGAA